MKPLKEIIKSKDFWKETIHCEIWRQFSNPRNKEDLIAYADTNKLNKTNLPKSYAKHCYFKYSVNKLIDSVLAVDKIPIIKFITPKQYLNNRIKIEEFFENL